VWQQYQSDIVNFKNARQLPSVLLPTAIEDTFKKLPQNKHKSIRSETAKILK